MNAICVIDSSLPPYAAPLARECVATVLVPTPTPLVGALTPYLCLFSFIVGAAAIMALCAPTIAAARRARR